MAQLHRLVGDHGRTHESGARDRLLRSTVRRSRRFGRFRAVFDLRSRTTVDTSNNANACYLVGNTGSGAANDTDCCFGLQC